MNIGRLPQQPIVQLKSQIKPEEVNEEIKQEEVTNTKEASDETVQEAPVNAASFLGQESYCAQMGIRFVSKKSSITPHKTTNSNIGADLQNTVDKKDNKPDITKVINKEETMAYGKGKIIISIGKDIAKWGWNKLKKFGTWATNQIKTFTAQTAIEEAVDSTRDNKKE